MSLPADMLTLIHDNVDCGIFTVDNDRRITSWNRGAERITGHNAAEMVGRVCCELDCLNCFKKGNGNPADCIIFREGELKSVECVICRPDGTRVRVLRNGRLLKSPAGQTLGAVETLTDITPLRPEFPEIPGEDFADEDSRPVPGMIGRSREMREVYRLVRFAADSESTVLVTGESGTGKELAARAIHRLSRRSSGAFVAVNCSALPESLLESELFGHVRGAFSGAIANKVGRFEMAGAGTVFLDEIGDISPLIQLKLLRVLQDHQYQRVGESESRTADVRVIAATNRDLLNKVRKGEFREDLYFRLKVFPVGLPALRDRKSDIPELVEYFVELFNRRTGKSVARLHPEAMKLLLGYCWPGNVRELEHAIEYAFVLCQTDEIGPFELPQEILRVELRKQFCPPGQQNFLQAASAPETRNGENARRPGGRVQPAREELLRALESHGWNRTAVARYFGVSRVTVWNWMNRLGIDRPGTS